MSRNQAESLRGEDAERIAVKHSLLKQDYQELQREIRALKKRIQRAKIKKENLLGVVRFLRRRYKMLKGLGSVEPARQSMAYESGPGTSLIDGRHEPATSATSIQEEAAPVQGSGREQYLTLDGCETPEIRGSKPLVARDTEVFSEPQSTAVPSLLESFRKKSLIESNELVSALKSSKFKDSPNGLIPSKRPGKRKISWQDEAPLKV